MTPYLILHIQPELLPLLELESQWLFVLELMLNRILGIVTTVLAPVHVGFIDPSL